MDLIASLFDNIAVLIWHIIIGLFFAGIILAVNHYVPYSFSNKPKDVMYRKFFFYVTLFIVFAFSWFFDLFYLNDSISDNSGKDASYLTELIDDLAALIPLSAIISTIAYAGIYYAIALYMKNKLKLHKCFSVFKFK
ncbi:MAG: hypothetical protein NT109_00265 [Flavobacteriia bacterium]|nr:hypothetical protein [Flavobacteriia bacterium]